MRRPTDGIFATTKQRRNHTMLERILNLLLVMIWAVICAIIGAIVWAVVSIIQAIFHVAQQIHQFFQ
jgi:type III secretory pathway component EscS